MAVHPLRPATHHRLGEPLPHQLTNGTQSSLTAHIAFITRSCDPVIISGISIRFQMLSQSVRQVLTRYSPSATFTRRIKYRLACVKHSVSVHPEPGSNSSFNLFTQLSKLIGLHLFFVLLIFSSLSIMLLMSLFSYLICFILCTAFLRHIDYNIINTSSVNNFFQLFLNIFILLKNPLFC